MTEKQRLQLLAIGNDQTEGSPFDIEAIVQSDDLQLKAIGRQKLDVSVVHKVDSIQIDHAQVGSVSTDLADVHNLYVKKSNL